jgi:uncharacterized protein YlxW (UPF0749 family)
MAGNRGGTRGQIVVAVLLALLGFAAAAQIRITNQDGSYAGQRRENLIALLDSLSAAADRTQTQINELERTRSDLLSNSERRQAAVEEARRRLTTLGILAGTLAAEGPGVTVTITDPSGSVTAASILNGIEELRDAGAEAIEINDRVRVVASTAFTERRGEIVVDGQPLRPPYLIDAIGSSHTLSEAVVFPGGLADEVRQLGGDAAVEETALVRVLSLHPAEPPEYSQPTEN